MIKNRNKDKAIRVCDECGHESEVNYWNLTKKNRHLCKSCSNSKTNLGREPYNKGKRSNPEIGTSYISKDGYRNVYLGRYKISSGYTQEHRIIAAFFYPDKFKLGCKVHHINGDKLDNKADNLFVCENMSHHRKIHSQLESISMELIKSGLIVFNREKQEYELSRPIKKFIEEKQSELLENPVKDNQQPSLIEMIEKVQRLFLTEVESSDSKRSAP
ncbi:MAG: HNH endonuclease [Microcystis sp. M110S1]|uniref:HNH endonuclease n=1 Tax=Microcystis sp. M110S1 TaxID=2771102 RepID=UPI00258922E1|nr:HNH endonuclease [Microcystis sp. M110S1]MCA2973869.1 HNH endonuclease [Microcystis sp. M110S1]